ncbi:GDP-mannose transporter into the lumen of the Golgi [Ascosphaera pollenicola]|nr:GDP-mannose transporter into the lumen of the Golgi [Ascosphaera pollenicola]
MGKTKKARIPNYNHHDGPARKRADRSPPPAKKSQKAVKQNQQKQQQQQQNKQPIIPFHKSDRILLVGEGDFSFAKSLVEHHGCQRVLATCFDKEDVLYEKYPQTREYVEHIFSIGSGSKAVTEDSKGKSKSRTGEKRKREDDDVGEGEASDSSDDEEGKDGEEEEASQVKNANKKPKQNRVESLPHVLFEIDARKLGSGLIGGGKTIRNGFPRQTSDRRGQQQQQQQQQQQDGPKGGPWDVICFNFPHVGGLSKDVNRQVRANQDLLVSFFKASVPLLSAPPPEAPPDNDFEDEEYGYGSNPSDFSDFSDGVDYEGKYDMEPEELEKPKLRTEPGQILVTLFEGEPYTLWNIRDLARHSGLRVVMSFKFPWASYPGYAHARTIGEIEGKHGGRGGWRGEDREARTYVFERKEWENIGQAGNKKGGSSKTKSKKKKKNAKGADDSD